MGFPALLGFHGCVFLHAYGAAQWGYLGACGVDTGVYCDDWGGTIIGGLASK